jgi:predicted ester cyclase
MSRDDVQNIMRQFRDAAGRRDVLRLMSLYDEDAIAISPSFGEIRGRAAIAAAWERQFSAFNDFAFVISDVLLDGDRVAVLGKATATDRMGWFGIPATGGTIDYRLALLLTLAGGKIIRDERIFDSTGVMAQLEKARLDNEMRTAAELQRALLPQTTHDSPFCHLAGDSVPCRAIGGDFFELVELPSGALGIAIGDIAGKGPAAALLAAMLQGMFSTAVAAGCGPAVILSQLNQGMLERRLAPRFATLVYAEISPDGRLVYSNAGHCAPALLTRDGIRRLTTGGTILGVFGDAAFEEETVQLRGSDTLVMFTDGVTEACNPLDQEFGEDRLLGHLGSGATTSPKVLVKQIFASLREFCDQAEQSDDATLTITRFVQPC